MTEKENNVIKFMINRPNQRFFGLELTPIIFNAETIKRWSHGRRHKVIIDTLTYSYLGRMVKKGILEWNREGYSLNKNYMND